MSYYELMVLVPPDLEESSKSQFVKSLKEMLKEAGGEVVNENDLGKKELAYPIAKHSFANFLYFEAEIPPRLVADVDRKLRINDLIIRHLLVKSAKSEKTKPEKETEKATETKKAQVRKTRSKKT